MLKFIKTDSFWLGIVVGIVIPGAAYGLLYLINSLVINSRTGLPFIEDSTVQIISLIFNALLLRYFLINKKFDKAGRGILFVTFIAAIVFFAFNSD